ncbi:hypothetical protein HJFPF1_11880 [Paramyrothecium foliicola]|nr:hypothetical protein HJFPF1_11880 [Paramyrothecium foliicola]
MRSMTALLVGLAALTEALPVGQDASELVKRQFTIFPPIVGPITPDPTIPGGPLIPESVTPEDTIIIGKPIAGPIIPDPTIPGGPLIPSTKRDIIIGKPIKVGPLVPGPYIPGGPIVPDPTVPGGPIVPSTKKDFIIGKPVVGPIIPDPSIPGGPIIPDPTIPGGPLIPDIPASKPPIKVGELEPEN